MISSTVQRNDYAGPSAGPDYTYSFKVFDDDDLRVIFRDALGAVSVLTLGVDYTVTGVGEDAGGFVQGVGALLAGETLTIRRARPFLQETDIRNQGPFDAAIHEDAFDRAEMDAQFLADEVSRALKLPESEVGSASATELPRAADRANKVLGYDGSGNLIALTAIPAGSVIITAWAETLLDDPDAATARTTLGGICPRTIVAGAGIGVTNGDGVAGNPTVTNTDHSDYLVTKLDVERMRPGFVRNLLLVYSTPTVAVINGGRCFSEILGGLYYEMDVSVALNVDLAVGGVPNGLDVAPVGPNAWYYIWLIKNLGTGVVAGLASLSDTVPTLPAGYSAKRLIGAIRTDGGSQIIPFYCRGYNAERKFYWPTPRLILSTGLIGPGGGAASLQPGAPPSVTLGAVYLDLKSQCAGLAAGAIGTMAIGCVGTSSMVFVDSIVQVAGTVSPVGQTALEMPNTFAAYLVYWNVGGGAGITQVSAYIACTAFEMEL